MKIGVVSDSHGNRFFLQKAIQKMSEVELIFHLGDLASDGYFISEKLKKPVVSVRGNCDFSLKAPAYQKIEVAGKSFFLTHGHLYHVQFGYDRLIYKAEEEQVDVALFGHTHMSMVFSEKGILFMNPGSTVQPRGGRPRSIGILLIQEGKIIPSIVNIDE